MNCQGKGKNRKRGMTLIEILVVIAIIAILAAIIIPGSNKIRESAEAAKCASNQKQIATALFAYASDFQGEFPVPAGIKNGDHSNTTRWTRHPDFDSYLPKGRQDNLGQKHWENPIFICPSARGVDDKKGLALRVTYLATGALLGNDGLDRWTSRKLNTIYAPERTLLLVDGHLNVPNAAPTGTNYTGLWQTAKNDVGKSQGNTNSVEYRHNGQFIAAMADGSINRFSPEDMENRAGAAVREETWRGIQDADN